MTIPSLDPGVENPPPEESQQLAGDLRVALMRSARRIRQQRSDVGGLSDAQFSVLSRLYVAGPQTLGALAEHDRVQPPSMTRTIAAMETAGLLQRSVHPEDRRAVLVDLTEHGRQQVQQARCRTNAWLAAQLELRSPDERRILADAARILLEMTAV